MNRQEATAELKRMASTIEWDYPLDAQIAIEKAVEALTGPNPDPITGLVPCGCGGKVDVAFYPGWARKPDLYQVDCFSCHVGTRPCQTAEQAKASWNTAMGWRVEG